MTKRRKLCILSVSFLFILILATPISAYNNTRFNFRLRGIQVETIVSDRIYKTDSDPAVIAANSDSGWKQGEELIAYFIMPYNKSPIDSKMATPFLHIWYSGSYTLQYDSQFRVPNWYASLWGSIAKSNSGYTWVNVNGVWCP